MGIENTVRINQNFMMRYLQSEGVENLFAAASTTISGEFFLEGLDIHILISDSEMDDVLAAQEMLIDIRSNNNALNYSEEEIKSAENIYTSFMQAHNHELAHLYQVLALPAFQLVWATRFNFLKLEAAVMLRFFEQEGVFLGEKHSKLLEVLNDNHPLLEEEFAQQFNDFEISYKLYITNYNKEFKGISLFYIIEAMAHVMSLQLSDNPANDILGIGVATEYSIAYDLFNSHVEGMEINIRWKYLLFIYISYFSCQHFDPEENGSGIPSVHIFIFLCSRAGEYAKALLSLYKTYEDYSIDELRMLNKWSITKSEIEFANHKQLAGLYSFFELIEMIENEAFPNGIQKKKLTTGSLSDFFTSSKNKGINWEDKYILARMLIFPANFIWIREVYDDVMGIKGVDKEFTYAQEAEFYRFIMSCKHLLQPSHDVLCCQEHGMRDQRKKVLRCKNEGGLAFYLEALTGKLAYNLFQF